MKKIIAYTLLFIMLSSIFVIIPEAKDPTQNTQTFDITLSDLIVKQHETTISLKIPETTVYTTEPGKPRLPVIEKTYTYPIGTKINDITIIPENMVETPLSTIIDLVPIPQPVGTTTETTPEYNFYQNPTNYPDSWMTYSIGRGIIKGDPSIILKIHIYPIQYHPDQHKIIQASSIHYRISSTYQPTVTQETSFSDEDYSLIILAPEEFKSNLQPLVIHKNSRDISTKIITLSEILGGTYFPVQGRDDPEKIKYFIKNAYDKWETQYVLLVGDKEHFPVRETYVYLFRDDGDDDEIIVSDLYYADIYDNHNEFETWDTTNNSRFGEYAWDGNTDWLDLYPDVYLGRLACEDTDEVDGVVNKIIVYENQESFRQSWYKNLVLIGGDSFPAHYEEHSGINEGELANQHVSDVMVDFIPEKLWASNTKLAGTNPSGVDRINEAINDGCGFVHFSGHGSDTVWTTYPHNGTRQSLPTPFGSYNIQHVRKLSNGYQLPIVVTGACSVGKFQTNPDCFSWLFVENPNGGAIASFGATALGYAALGANVTDYVIEKMGLEMFKAYEIHEAKTVGEMWATAITNYITPVMYGTDYKTVEEWEPFCDPSMALREEYLIPSEPPLKPTIEGPKTGNAGETYTYNVTTTDPDRNQVEYLFDWGDDTFSDWLGPVDSGETFSVTKTWEKKGTYEVRVKARDENGYESEWSRTHFVTLTRAKISPFIYLINIFRMIYETAWFTMLFPF
jgi:hypothetical protein